MNDFESVIDDFYADAPPYCNGCGHFHSMDDRCPDNSASCGNYLCCHGMSDDDDDTVVPEDML